MGPVGSETKNDFAGEAQKQISAMLLTVYFWRDKNNEIG
jgi:hypothetical protein